MRKDAIASPVFLEMSLGRPEACLEPAQTATVAANQCGFHKKTARRARTLVTSALQTSTDNKLKEHINKHPRIRAMKASWDEMALRMWLPRSVVAALFPEFEFPKPPPESESVDKTGQEAASIRRRLRVKKRVRPEPQEPQARSRNKHGKRDKQKQASPTFCVQIMQTGVGVLLESDTSTLSTEIVTSPKIVQSTKATDLFDGLDASVPVSEIFSEASYDDACAGFLYGDSLFANKLVHTQVATQNPTVPMQDSPCYGCVPQFATEKY